MNLRPMLLGNALLIAAIAGLTGWAWVQVPEGTLLPVHFGIDGTPDRQGSRAEALLIMPALAVLVTFIFWITPRLDPRRANIEASGKFWNAIAISVVAFLTYMQTLIVLSVTGHQVNVTDSLVPALGLLFVVIGNYLSKTRANWFGGIRTPWTMSSDYSWNRTHRVGGTLYILSGFASIAAWALLDTKPAVITLIALILGSSLLTVVLSYWFWRQDPARSHDA